MRVLPTLLLLGLLGGCGGSAADTSDEAAPKPVAEVTTAVASSSSAVNEITLYGVTEPTPGGQHALVAPAEAVVANVAAPTGTAIGVGRPVVTLRPSLAIRMAAAKASSDLVAAQAAYARAVRLKADGLGSQADIDTARAAVNAARVSAGYLGIPSGGLTLRAPVAGTVQGLTVKPGDQVAAGVTLATIATRGDVRAKLGIDPTLAATVHAGQPVTIDPVGTGATVTTTVAGVDPQIDPTTRLASVYARVPGATDVAAGEPLKAHLLAGGTTSGVTIPYAALLDEGGQSYVFVVSGGVAKRVDVVPGSSAGDSVQVVKGLNPGDRVVVQGGTALEDGMRVHQAARR